jgi:AcrR family transcriptional regulator
VAGATTRRIADAAQAPLATLHYCFHTKEQLFFAVFQHASDQLVERITATEVGSDLAKATTSLLVTTMDWFVENDAYAHAQYDLYMWALRQESTHPGLATRAYGLFIDRFAEILRKDLRPDEDAELVEPLARLVTSILDGMALQWHGHRDRARLDADIALAGEAIDLLVESRRRQQRKPA